MTEERIESEFRFRKKSYRQPKFEDTPPAENANNARYPIHHFATELTVYRFENPIGRTSRGIQDRGEPTAYQAFMEVQPLTIGERFEMKQYFGERLEDVYWFILDPYDPRHIELYSKPFFVRTGDDRRAVEEWDADANGGHADIVLWHGQNYIIRIIEPSPSARYEEEHGRGGYQEGYMHLWRDVNQKKHQTDVSDSIIND